MGDNHRVYSRISQGLRQLYPKQLTGRQARHLNTLAGMVTGIVRSGKSHFKAMAQKAPDQSKTESRIKRFARYVQNEQVDAHTYYMPYLEALLAGLARCGPLVLVMNGSEVGRGCLALVISVIYKQRALPLAWIVVKGSKGHFPQESHVALLQQIQPLIPKGNDVIFLGDGEFDGVDLQAQIAAQQWQYVCRTARNRILCDDGDEFSLQDVHLRPGQRLEIPDVGFSQDNYGPVLVIAWWRKQDKAPIYLVSNMELAAEACFWYRKRFSIETFFSDQKSRGFHLHKSHIADPERMTRLLIATCLAYIWIISLGVMAHLNNWVAIIHRSDRCDLSLFQLGLDLLDHLLNQSEPIPIAFCMPQESN